MVKFIYNNSIDINASFPDLGWIPEGIFKAQLKVGAIVPVSHTFGHISREMRKRATARDAGFHGDILDIQTERADVFCFVCDELFYLAACGTRWMPVGGKPGGGYPVRMTAQVSGRGDVGPGLLPDLRHLVANPETPTHFTGQWEYPHAEGGEPLELHGIATAIPVALSHTEAVNGNYSRARPHDGDDGTYRCPVCRFGEAAGQGKSKAGVDNHFSRMRKAQPYPRDFQPNLVSEGLIDLVDGVGFGLGLEFESANVLPGFHSSGLPSPSVSLGSHCKAIENAVS